jgi:predicted dinucleotide-binding enzyme
MTVAMARRLARDWNKVIISTRPSPRKDEGFVQQHQPRIAGKGE